MYSGAGSVLVAACAGGWRLDWLLRLLVKLQKLWMLDLLGLYDVLRACGLKGSSSSMSSYSFSLWADGGGSTYHRGAAERGHGLKTMQEHGGGTLWQHNTVSGCWPAAYSSPQSKRRTKHSRECTGSQEREQREVKESLHPVVAQTHQGVHIVLERETGQTYGCTHIELKKEP